MTITIASICVGMSVDYAIHFAWRYLKENDEKKTLLSAGRAILITGFTIILGFFVLNSFMTSAFAEALVHGFKNPSFSGTGYSQHVLSIDQLQETRKKQAKDDKKSAEAAKKREENNTTINKFGKKLPPVKTGQRFGEEIKKDKNKTYRHRGVFKVRVDTD